MEVTDVVVEMILNSKLIDVCPHYFRIFLLQLKTGYDKASINEAWKSLSMLYSVLNFTCCRNISEKSYLFNEEAV